MDWKRVIAAAVTWPLAVLGGFLGYTLFAGSEWVPVSSWDSWWYAWVWPLGPFTMRVSWFDLTVAGLIFLYAIGRGLWEQLREKAAAR